MTKNNKDALLIEKKNRKLKDEISKMKNRLATAFDIDTTSISDVEDYLSGITDTNIKILKGTIPQSKFIEIISLKAP